MTRPLWGQGNEKAQLEFHLSSSGGELPCQAGIFSLSKTEGGIFWVFIIIRLYIL